MKDISYINTQKLSEIISIEYNEINTKNLDQKIYNKLLEKIDNKCYKNGFILKNSIKMINKSLCKLENLDSENKLVCKANFSVNIIQPGVEDIIECYIDNINKMGIIAYIKLKDIIEDYNGGNTLNDSPLIIIIPLQLIENIDTMNIGKKIKVEVNATRIKFNANQIQIVGTIIE